MTYISRFCLIVMLICAYCLTIHAFQNSNRNSISSSSSSSSSSSLSSRKIMRLNMQNDNRQINTKPISLISAATIAASLMGMSSVGAVEKWVYGKEDDALTQKLIDRVSKQSSPSGRPDVGIRSPSKSSESKSVNIQIPDIKVEIPSLPDIKVEIPSLPDIKVEIPSLPDIKVELPDIKVDESINSFKQAASEYANSISIGNKERSDSPDPMEAILPKISIPETNSQPINIEFPPFDPFKAGGNKLLTTTVQTEKPVERSKTISNDIGKPTISAPVIDDSYSQVRKQLQAVIDINKVEWGYVLAAVGFVLVFDAISGQPLIREGKEEKEKLNAKLETDLKVKEEKEKLNAKLETDLKVTASTEKQMKDQEESELLKSKASQMADKVSSLEQELARSKLMSAKLATSDETITKLNAKVASLESDLKNAVSGTGVEVSKSNPVSVSSSSSSIDTSAWEAKITLFQKREEAIVEVLKKFLVSEGYLPQGMANMLLASTIVETLEKTSTSSKTSADEVASLKKSIAKLEKANTDLKKMEMDARKYVAQLRGENDDLKQKLLQSDERLFDLQQQMQSKLDSAKAVAKDLNEKLLVATKLKEKEASPKKEEVKEVQQQMQSKVDSAKAVAKYLNEKLLVATKLKEKEASPKKEEVKEVKGSKERVAIKEREVKAATAVKPAAVKKVPAKESAKASVPAPAPAKIKQPKLELNASQLQRKTKKDLGDLLRTYGVLEIDGVKVDACLKTDIILALEKFR